MNQTIQERNKVLVLDAFDTLLNKRDYEAAERYWSPQLYPAQRTHRTWSRWIVQFDPERT